MFATAFSRSTIARFAIAGMVLAVVTAIAPTASATGGSVDASSYSFNRAATDNSVLFRAGEEGQLISEARLSEEYSGWPVANKSIFTRTAFSLKRPDPGILPDYPLEVNRSWNGWNYSDEQNPCDELYVDQPTLTVTTPANCINSLVVRDTYYLQNNTDGPLSVDTNFASQVVKIGKKGKKAKTLSESDGLTNTLFGGFYVYDEASVDLTAADSSLTTDFEVCIDESLVENGDVLAVDYGLSHGSTPVTSESFYIYDWNGGEFGTWDYTDEDAVTFEIGDNKPAENLVLGFSLVMQDELNYDDTTESGTYSGTVDIVNTDAGNVSVTEPCGPLGGPGWREPSTDGGPAGSPVVAETPQSWNASGMTPSDDVNQYVGYSDSFGGMWFSEYPASGETDVALAHLGEGGNDGDFNGTGTRLLTLGEEGDLDLTSFGSNGGNYASLTRSSRTAWTLTTNSKDAPAGDLSSYTVTSKNLTKLCPSKYSVNYVFGISAPTTSLMAYLYCAKKDLQTISIIKFDAGVPKLVTRLGSPTSSRPCVVPQSGMDTRANGGDAALIIYTRTSSLDSNGYCGMAGSTVSKRALTTIDTAGIAVTTNVAVSPWGSEGEPDSLQIAAGIDKGTWIGFSGYYNDNYWGLTPGNIFTIEGSTPAFAPLGEQIILDETRDIGSANRSIVPVKEVSPTQWLVSGQGLSEFDSERFYNSTIGTINLETGEITWGDVVTASDFGYWPSGNEGQFSGVSDQSPTLYVITDFQNPNFSYSTYSWSSGVN
jgi:hypothetical protein